MDSDEILSNLFSLDAESINSFDCLNEETASSSTKRPKTRSHLSAFRPREDLWKFFDTELDGAYRCNICLFVFKGRPSTTVARRHFEKRHSINLSDPSTKEQADLVSTLLEFGSLLEASGELDFEQNDECPPNKKAKTTKMTADEQPLAQGKTKAIYKIADNSANVRVKSFDSLTAFNAKRKNEIGGKGQIASKTTCNVFRYLNECGIKTHFVKEIGNDEFEAKNCAMIPIEWVSRRVATGSFLKRNPGVKEGYTFTPPLIETFFKDDANDDPQWSEAQILSAAFEFNGRKIGKHEYNYMARSTSTIFRILERAWHRQGCVLVDMKIEFGITTDGDLVLADVIDNDSWRVWPNGDRRLQLDKQFYRDLPQVTDEALKELKKNYDRVERLTHEFLAHSTRPRAVIVMGSGADKASAEKIAQALNKFGVEPVLRVSSAHKSPPETLEIIAEYENDPTPTLFIAIAGRSNGLGPVLASNTILPVINAPPITPEWAAQDIWSSLRMPTGVGCTTVLGVDEAALAAAKNFSSTNHFVYAKLLANMLNNVEKILDSDRTINEKK